MSEARTPRGGVLACAAGSLVASFLWGWVFTSSFDIFRPAGPGAHALMMATSILALVLGLLGARLGTHRGDRAAPSSRPRSTPAAVVCGLAASLGALLLLATIAGIFS